MMFRLALFTKFAIVAAVVFSFVLGQPLYAQGQNPPTGTGKTLTAALLGKQQAREEVSTLTSQTGAGQTVRIRIIAADAASGSYANVDTAAPFHDVSIKVYTDVVYNHSAEVQCMPNGEVAVLKGTRYRPINGTLVPTDDARLHVVRKSAGGVGGNIIVFDIVDSYGNQQSIEMRGTMTISNSPCS